MNSENDTNILNINDVRKWNINNIGFVITDLVNGIVYYKYEGYSTQCYCSIDTIFKNSSPVGKVISKNQVTIEQIKEEKLIELFGKLELSGMIYGDFIDQDKISKNDFYYFKKGYELAMSEK